MSNVILNDDGLFHRVVVINKQGVAHMGYLKCDPGTDSNFAFSFNGRWYCPPTISDTKLVRKTKTGVFIYEEISG